LEEETSVMTETISHVPKEEVRRLIAAYVAQKGSQSKAAQALKMSAGNLTNMLSGKVNPGNAALGACGLKKITVYVQKREPGGE
jgi:hypothetical protein